MEYDIGVKLDAIIQLLQEMNEINKLKLQKSHPELFEREQPTDEKRGR